MRPNVLKGKKGATSGRNPGPRKIPQAGGRLSTWRRKRR